MNPYRVFWKTHKDQKPPYKFDYITAVSKEHAERLWKEQLGNENLIVHCVKPV